MSICKYFLQGTCRYGDRCRFDHPQDYSSGGSGYRTGRSQGNFDDDGSAGYRSRGAAGGGYQNQSGSYQSRGGDYDNRSGNYRGGDYGSRGGNYRSADYGSRGGGYQGRADDYRSPDRDQYSRSQYDNRNQSDRNAPFQQTAQSSNRFQQLSTDSRPTFAEILDWISEEMEIWGKSGMWPFSTFAFSHSVRSLPGMDDMSMEEIRFFAYEAQASGQFSKFVTWMQELSQDYQTKRQHLYKPAGTFRSTLISAIEDIVKTDGVLGSVTAAGQKASDAKPIIYGTGNQQPSTGFTASAVPNVEPSGGFGNPPQLANQPSSVTFGNIVKPTPSFQGFPTVAATPFLAAPQPATGTQPSAPFSTGPFSQPPPSIHSASSQQTLFGKSVFAPTATLPDSNVSTAGFGPSKPAVDASRGTQDPSSCYAPLHELAADERAAFDAHEFTLGNIPTRPPPRELI